MANTSFVRDIANDKSYSVKLITSSTTKGDFFYVYLLMRTEHVPFLEAALRLRNVDLREYGVILGEGKGIKPEESVKRDIERKFAFYNDVNELRPQSQLDSHKDN